MKSCVGVRVAVAHIRADSEGDRSAGILAEVPEPLDNVGQWSQPGRWNKSLSESSVTAHLESCLAWSLHSGPLGSMLFFVKEGEESRVRKMCLRTLLGVWQKLYPSGETHSIEDGFFSKLRDANFWQLRNPREFSSSLLAQSRLPRPALPTRCECTMNHSWTFSWLRPLCSQSVVWPPSKIRP